MGNVEIIKSTDVKLGDTIFAGGESRIAVDKIVRGTLGEVQAAVGRRVHNVDDGTEQWHYFASAPVDGKIRHAIVRGNGPVARVGN